MRPITISSLVIILLLFLLELPVAGQVEPEVLLNERFIDRPLNMHKNQMQINLGYGLRYETGFYDDEGLLLNLEEEGKSILTHNYLFDLRYGLLSFMELSLRTGILSKNESMRQVIKIGIDNLVSYAGNTETRGFDDLNLGVSLSLPFLPEFTGFSVHGGMSIPLRGDDPVQPEHELTFPYQIPGAYDIVYQFRESPGQGVACSNLGAGMRLAFSNMALISRVHYSFPIQEGTGYTWHSRIVGNSIEYDNETYTFLPRRYLDYSVSGIYQLFPWFAADLTIRGKQGKGGWQEFTGQQYSLPGIHSLHAGAGFEIMVTPMLRISQSFSFPVTGKNTYSGIFIFTGMNMNLFPF
ncbi:MAG: hypothetical protein WD577_04365 [Bacteroidales bacterium]